MKEPKARKIALKLSQVLEFLHDNGIILRNFDATGVLMTESEENKYENIPRISRLNKALVKGESEIDFVSGIFGDIRYRAPEVLQGLPYNKKADCWSYGVCLFYILAGVLPFDNYRVPGHDTKSKTEIEQEIENQILNQEPNFDLIKNKGYTQLSIKLCEKLLKKDPDVRLQMKALSKDEWFSFKF